MERIEKFFKDRIMFTRGRDWQEYFISKNVFNQEDYSIDFLKEKVKPLCYYLYSKLGQKNGNWLIFQISLSCQNVDTNFFIQAGQIKRFYKTEVWEEDKFLSSFERNVDKVKTEFSSLIPLKPFKIIVFIWKEYREGEE